MNTWGKGFTGIVLACALAACGGGGDGGSSNGGFADPNGFTMSATVGGTKVQSFSAGSGQTTALTVKSGQDLRLDTTGDVNWTSGNATSNTVVSVKGASTQSWTAGLMSPPGGTFTITATSAKDARKSAKLTVTVTPHEYTSGAPQTAGRVTTWTETTARLSGGAPEVHERVNTTTNVDSTTGYATMPSTVDGVADETYTQDADGNRIKRKRTDGSICTYTPKRTLVSFPLSVNKSWTSAWTYSCDTGYQETVNATSTVEAYEPVTIASGTFNALRIHHVQSITKSTDGNLPSGTYGIDMRCWWDVAGQRTVKCDQNYTYKDTAPANYVKTFSQDLKSVK